MVVFSARQVLETPLLFAQASTPSITAVQPETTTNGGTISGTVTSGTTPLPGVAVTATNTLTGKRYAAATDVNGVYSMTIPRNGRYVLKAELAAFASETQEVLINAAGQNGGKPAQVAAFAMQLASRVEQEQARQAAVSTSGLARGLQALSVTGYEASIPDGSAGAGNPGVQMPSLQGGVGNEAASTDSVTVNGSIGQTNGLAGYSEEDLRQRIQDAVAQAQRQGGAVGDMASGVAGVLGGLMAGGGLGGARGLGGGRSGGLRGFDPTQAHGAIFYQAGNGALNAAPFSIAAALGEAGAKVVKPNSMQNRFGISFAGSPFIPGLWKAHPKQFLFFNVTGMRNINPDIFNGTVPTLAERNGDFSSLPETLYDPKTGQPIAGNLLKNASVPFSPQALALLNYYPAPNVPDAGLLNNYQTVTNGGVNSTMAALRFVRSFGQGSPLGIGHRQLTNGPKTLRQNINFNGSYSHSASDLRSIFSSLGGTSQTNGYGATAGYTVGYGRLTNNASVNWNRSHSMVNNYFTNGTVNPAAQAGVLVGNAVVQSNPFYYGLPSLTFGGSNTFTSLSNTTPSDTINQTISFSDFVSWSHKRHNMRDGVDLRRVHADTVGVTSSLLSPSSSPLGAFSFTGYATENPAARSCVSSAAARCSAVPASGSGFADFLLGLPQQAQVQAGLSKTYLRANVLDWYAQDDWRILSNLTLNYGLRYEYFSPYVEKNDHLVNLDHDENFSAVVPVGPGQQGQFQGNYPRSLIKPDRTMYAPRLAFAWKPKLKFVKDTVVRGSYGINYNTGQYATIGRYMANQPPFAITQSNIAGQQGCGIGEGFTLAGAFNCSTAPVQNNYAANIDYRLGHVQIWDLDIQRTVPWQIVLNIGYNGSRGGALDLVRAPNRTASGLLNPDAQAFAYEDSVGYSRFNALRLNARKRMTKGVSLQATYQYGHSIDDASSVGGSSQTVAQDDLNLNAEEANSSFDLRQKLTGNWVIELPFGPNRAYLSHGGFWSKALDGFSVSGDFTFQTGNYFTPRFLLTAQEAATGTTDTLRPNRAFNVPIRGPKTLSEWFNPSAFAPPPAGQFGTSSRNSIEGPGTKAVDASLSRTVPLGETRSFEARVTAANVFNIVSFSGIDTTLNSPTFGQVTGAATMRTVTVLARYRF